MIPAPFYYPVENAPSVEGTVRGRAPAVSQAFSAPDHLGVDIMFARLPGETLETSPGNARWCMPRGIRAIALTAGRVVYAKRAANGWRVRLTHGPVDTLYLHLGAVPLVVTGQKVLAGESLGLVGSDPTDPEGLPHLHFELRVGTLGSLQTPVDPIVLLGDWIR